MDAAAAADYPQSPPPTNDVASSLLGRLGSLRRPAELAQPIPTTGR